MSHSFQDKISEGKKNKDAGNDHFKNGRIAEALKSYHHALLYLSGLDSSGVDVANVRQLSEETKKEIRDAIKATQSNMAACYLKQEKYEKVIQFCDKVIASDADNAKAHFRKGKAYAGLKDYDAAHTSLTKAAKLSPQDIGIRDELARVSKFVEEAQKNAMNEFKGKLL